MFENNFHRAGHDKKTTRVEKENNKIQKYDVRYAETSKKLQEHEDQAGKFGQKLILYHKSHVMPLCTCCDCSDR